jgi:hypothetical protein
MNPASEDDANAFNPVALAGTWEVVRTVGITQPMSEDGKLIHFTEDGRGYQFFANPNAPENVPERHHALRIRWFAQSRTGFFTRFARDPEGPIVRYGSVAGEVLTITNRERTNEFICSRVPPERVPAWFQEMLAAELER